MSAEKLREAPLEWLGPRPANTTTSGDRVAGFFLIQAADAAEARRIADGCPHLKHGGTVELRAIQPT